MSAVVEVCRIFGTLIADEQQVYDLNNLDDQLVLGIKGTLSVVSSRLYANGCWQGRRPKHAAANCSKGFRLGMPAIGLKGKGLWLNMALGIVGAIVGGIIFSVFGAGGVTGVNLYSIIVAVIGSIVVLWIYHAISGRRAM